MTFSEQVYQLVQRIPMGRVMTYGDIALALGKPGAARAVGTALHHNPDGSDITPCHRVVNAAGRLSPNFAFGGSDIQRQLLLAEGVPTNPGSPEYVDLAQYRWQPV